MTRRYANEVALRRALEDRLAINSGTSGITINRLRKECSFHRLLARFVTVGGPWALKGGVSVLWRVDPRLRGTADIDANWRGHDEALEGFLERASACDLNGGFSFAIGNARPLRGEADGGWRFPVIATMAGREFERFHLDINLTPADGRPVELLRVRTSPMQFADVDVPNLTIPVISLAQQLAEKLHACMRAYGHEQASSRPKDAFDTVAIASLVPVPSSGELLTACEETFIYRGDLMPTEPPSLPAGRWEVALNELLADCPIPVASDATHLRSLFTAFWKPILGLGQSSDLRFIAETWEWTRVEGP